MKNTNWLSDLSASLKKKGSKGLATLSLIGALVALAPKDAQSQTIVTKKQYEAILQDARNSQEPIGEEMALFLFGGGLEKVIQQEIERQNSAHPADSQDGNFSLFNDDEVKNIDEKNSPIMTKQAIEEWLKYKLDSLSQKDFARQYLAFHAYQESGGNLVGHQKGKGEMGSGWNLAAYPVSIHVNYLEEAKLPYDKATLEKLQSEFDAIYEEHMSEWKFKALTNRKSEDKASYESADLIELEKSRQAFVTAVYAKYIKPMVEKVFKQYYSSDNDAHKGSKKK